MHDQVRFERPEPKEDGCPLGVGVDPETPSPEGEGWDEGDTIGTAGS